MFQSLAIDHSGYSQLTFNSWECGWHSLLLRRFTLHRAIEDVTILPVAEQLISLFLGGEKTADIEIEGRWRPEHLDPGTVSIVAPDRPTRMRWYARSPDPLDVLQLHLPVGTTTRIVEELWDRDPARLRIPDVPATPDPVLRQTMMGLLRAARSSTPDLYAESAAEFITVHTLLGHGTAPELPVHGGEDARIRRARAYLRENLAQPLSLAGIAAEIGMSRYHFLRVFRQATGQTPHRYLTGLRIEQARRELEDRTSTMTEIALRCGFTSRTHFATAFRRQTGSAPSDYRRQHRRSSRQ